MKLIPILILCLLCLTKSSEADSSTTARMNVCRNIQIALGYQFIDRHRNLPVSWEDFDEIRMIKNGTMQRIPFQMKMINSFAIVPGAPEIQPQAGIPSEYGGNRLFMISRAEEFSDSTSSGRFAILVTAGDSPLETPRTFSYFIPEEKVQIILRQIKGFDPAIQPLAFDEISRDEPKEAIHLDGGRGADDSQSVGHSGDRDSVINPDQPSKYYLLLWTIGGFLIASFAVVWYWVNRRKTG